MTAAPLPETDLAPAPDDAVARLPDALDDYASLHAEDAAGLGQ